MKEKQMWIDSHCHLNHENITELGKPSELIAQARAANVSGLMTICCEIHKEFDELKQIATNHDNVWCSVGTHPHDAAVQNEQDISAEDIVNMVNNSKKVVAIGETGLDYYYNNSPSEDQKASFRKHIRASHACNAPLVIHTRDAEDDTVTILEEEGRPKGVLHCFSGTEKLARQGLDLGLYISFSGILTFKKAEELRKIAQIVPLDRVLVETDAPFLAPVPKRGKVNEPANVVHTGTFLAELLNKDVNEIAERTTENFFTLFSKAKETFKPL